MSILKKVSAIAGTILAINPTMTTSIAENKEYIKLKIHDEITNEKTPDIVVRVGEYPNKQGKRVYLTSDQLTSLSIPDDIQVHTDNTGFYISEFDINLKLSKAIKNALLSKGVKVNLQVAKDKSEDLNAAGRIAKATGAKMYLSVHHDYYEADTEGYTFITNQGDVEDKLIAQKLSNAISGGNVKQRNNREQDGYIGELNQTSGMINILGEFGFFSNIEELQKIISDEQVQYVAEQIAEELAIILK